MSDDVHHFHIALMCKGFIRSFGCGMRVFDFPSVLSLCGVAAYPYLTALEVGPSPYDMT